MQVWFPSDRSSPEFTEPKQAVEDAGAAVDVIGAQARSARTYHHDLDPGETFTVDKAFDEVSADDYDALLVPGGAFTVRRRSAGLAEPQGRDKTQLRSARRELGLPEGRGS